MSSIPPSRKQVCNEYAETPTASLVYERYIEKSGAQSGAERFPEGQRYSPNGDSRGPTQVVTRNAYGRS